jgi:TolB protein
MMEMVDKPAPLGRFDMVVWSVIVGVLLVTALLIWRGDQVGLRVVTIAPAPQTAGIAPKSQLRIRFDQALDPATVRSKALVLTPGAAGEVHVEADTLVFAPNATWNPDTTYTVEVVPGLRSLQGRVLHDPLRWTFATRQLSIAFSRTDANGKLQLMLASISLPEVGGNVKDAQLDSPQQVTNAPDGIWDFGVDANTGQIVYSQLRQDGTGDLWTLLPSNQEPSLLQGCPQALCSNVAFSPDSKLLVFSQRNASPFSAPAMSPPRLFLLELATGNVAPLFADSQKLAFDPRWSPDGKWLSFLAYDQGGVVLDQLESGTTRVYPTQTGETAVWNPRRNQMVMSEFLSDGPFEAHLILVDPLTETRQDLSDFEVAVDDNSPAFSPDGQWIAFRRKELDGPNETPGKQLWVMRGDGSEARALTAEPDFDHGPPTWSPDGRYLLYHRYPLRGPAITLSIWVMDVVSGRTWEIVSPGQQPMWLP